MHRYKRPEPIIIPDSPKMNVISDNAVVPSNTADTIVTKKKDILEATIENEDKMSRGAKIWGWTKTFVFGTMSLLSCCCLCCGACGNIKGPRTIVKYDEEYEIEMSATEKKIVNAAEWATLAGVTYKAGPLCCCCCCGCCGLIGPAQGVVALGLMDKKR